MATQYSTGDELFLRAEQMARDFALFPTREDRSAELDGLLSRDQVRERVAELEALDVDTYIERTVLPSEDKSRLDARKVLRRLKGKTLLDEENGPLYWAEVDLAHGEKTRRIGFLVQNRSANNGAWMPEHHLAAVRAIRGFTQRKLPIVTFIDTPGADAGAEANERNQAHSISHLIAEMAQIDVPCVGIVMGAGYSGGAIPLATVNILLSVRDGVFNTIQPQGLASIVRKYGLSWQECARFVGVSPYELYEQGYIDGIVDFVPGERDELENLRKAIFSSIAYIERKAQDFVARTPLVFEHYTRSMRRYLQPDEDLKRLQEVSSLSVSESPTSHLNIFGVAYRYMRYLSLRQRIRSMSRDSYGRLSDLEIPRGDLAKRAEDERLAAFADWLKAPLELRYDDKLLKTWRGFRLRRRGLSESRGRFRRLVFGSAESQYDDALSRVCLDYSLYLYSLWKTKAPGNMRSLIAYLREHPAPPPPRDDGEMTVLDVMRQEEVREKFIEECEALLIFDVVYDQLFQNLSSVAREASESNSISKASIEALLGSAMKAAADRCIREGLFPHVPAEEVEGRLQEQFHLWVTRFMQYPDHDAALKTIEGWKKQAFPRMSETLFAIVTFVCNELLPQYYAAKFNGQDYDGKVRPRNIGIKDFWNRLAIAYRDLQIQDVLLREKRRARLSADAVIQRFFTDFNELNAHLMTADPAGFPGFRLSIEEGIGRGIEPCGLITGIGRFQGGGRRPLMGVAVSNLKFQAGAFDMASAEKFCALMRECMLRDLPIVCFISSGGMQTKEGAGALFSMPIVNDRLTRFIRDQNLPVICFGFGDCTGGAQASFVTHPLVQTYYLSGTNMPFAGQIVVPSYLPSTSTLSNYLSATPGAMRGLVKNPFWPTLDQDLQEIDARMPMPSETVEAVVERVLEGRFLADDDGDENGRKGRRPAVAPVRPIRRVLIHARGCSAAKLIRKAREHGIQIVLVQSDADAESAVAEMLGDDDLLVCIGGNTPDESYLNAPSIIRIAEQEKVDAIHPGIGFLSETADFASLCRSHGFIFVGPSVTSMEIMGNKSNAIYTARRLKVPVVPGSEGIVTTPQAARRIAGRIGYPVLIKAVFGGGGKGIRVVYEPDHFNEAFRQIRAEAKNAFGNSDVYLEKYVTSMRHVEVQILRDTHGNTRVLGLRDCTVQRNNQKLIEESGSSMLPPELEESVFRYAEQIADEIDYHGAGTVEFIYDIRQRAVYFMEMNTRLQVEHPVTEMVTGIDIVKAQFDIAGGLSIADMRTGTEGYSIEVRINAEMLSREADGQIVIRPAPGTVSNCYFPEADGVDVLTCIGPDKAIPPFYDNLIAQIVVKGRNRPHTIDRMIQYLDGVQIRGVSTNIPLLRHVLADETFRGGEYDTGYLPKQLARLDVDALQAGAAGGGAPDRKALSEEAIRIEGTDELKVLAPSTGVFYLTPSPAEPEMVKVGDAVTIDKRLCMLEAMKLFTSLTLRSYNREGAVLYAPERKYKVVRIVPSTGQVVNAGDLLLVVEPV